MIAIKKVKNGGEEEEEEGIILDLNTCKVILGGFMGSSGLFWIGCCQEAGAIL